ncbi:MAG: hypothetical protein Ta2E_12080 [Mycoplasmoidaceae bacterium]|nr:MAG: hypothetical protein Ta2E_12080 [Mycoplasmoidaceae bacterium]
MEAFSTLDSATWSGWIVRTDTRNGKEKEKEKIMENILILEESGCLHKKEKLWEITNLGKELWRRDLNNLIYQGKAMFADQLQKFKNSMEAVRNVYLNEPGTSLQEVMNKLEKFGKNPDWDNEEIRWVITLKEVYLSKLLEEEIVKNRKCSPKYKVSRMGKELLKWNKQAAKEMQVNEWSKEMELKLLLMGMIEAFKRKKISLRLLENDDMDEAMKRNDRSVWEN